MTTRVRVLNVDENAHHNVGVHNGNNGTYSEIRPGGSAEFYVHSSAELKIVEGAAAGQKEEAG